MNERNERGLPVYCSECSNFAQWYGAGVTPYCDEYWREVKTRRAGNTVPIDVLQERMLNAEGRGMPAMACQLAKKLVNYQVIYLPNVPCTCGCELWRPVLGTMECCRCSPSPLCPDKYDQEIKWLYLRNAIS